MYKTLVAQNLVSKLKLLDMSQRWSRRRTGSAPIPASS